MVKPDLKVMRNIWHDEHVTCNQGEIQASDQKTGGGMGERKEKREA